KRSSDFSRRTAAKTLSAGSVTTSIPWDVATAPPADTAWMRSAIAAAAMLEVLGDDRMVRSADPVLQLHDRVDHRFRPRRAAGHVHIDRNDLVDAGDCGVVLVEPAARRAGA